MSFLFQVPKQKVGNDFTLLDEKHVGGPSTWIEQKSILWVNWICCT